MLQEKCLAVFYLPPTQIACLFSEASTVVADTSMITLSTEYAAHFCDIYIDGKENAIMTGDRMKMLMLTLPFMVRHGDLRVITPEVILSQYVQVCPVMYWYVLVSTHLYWNVQVELINKAINNAKAGSHLRCLPHVADPSN